MPHPDNVELLVKEGELDRFELPPSAAVTGDRLGPGEILVRVEKFGLSANNVSYALMGRSLQYFSFFPTTRAGWGAVPGWGMGRIVESHHHDLAAGARLYGFLPLARYARLEPARCTPTGFDVDRGALPAAYNQYALVDRDPFYLPTREDHMILFRPLFFTDFFLDDYLIDTHACFGADTVVISSASSKTAFGLAFMLVRRRASSPGARLPRVIGLTSAAHVPFVDGLRLYDQVVRYDDVASLPRSGGAVLVDVAGNTAAFEAVRTHLGSRLKAGVLVGMSHWDKSSAAAAPDAFLAPPAGTHFFFAPSQVETRLREWGPARTVEKVSAAWREFMEGIDARCHLTHGCGQAAVASAYQTMLEGRQPPERGVVLSLWEDAFARASGDPA